MSPINTAVLEALKTKEGRNKLRKLLGPPLDGIVEIDIDNDTLEEVNDVQT